MNSTLFSDLDGEIIFANRKLKKPATSTGQQKYGYKKAYMQNNN